MDKLFSGYRIGGLDVCNRIIRAGMFGSYSSSNKLNFEIEPCCDNGTISEEFISIHVNHVLGGVGLTTTGFSTLDKEGSVNSFQLDLSENSVDDLKSLTKRIHDIDGAIALQLSFSGLYEFVSYPRDYQEWFVLKEYDQDQLNFLIDKFVDKSVFAYECGFDAIEIHHFFISQFLYKETNLRNDEFGGSVEKRSNFPVKLISRIREEIEKISGDNCEEFPIFAKFMISPTMPQDELLYYAMRLRDSGVSGIVTFPSCISLEDEVSKNYCFESSIEINEMLQSTNHIGNSAIVIFSGGIGTLEDILLAMDYFELIQIGRGLLRDFELPNKIRDGEEFEKCFKCSICQNYIWEDYPELICVFNKTVPGISSNVGNNIYL